MLPIEVKPGINSLSKAIKEAKENGIDRIFYVLCMQLVKVLH